MWESQPPWERGRGAWAAEDPPASARREASGPRAGFGVRLLALLVDGFLLTVVALLAAGALGLSQTGADVLDVVIGAVYFTALLGGRRGQTLGARLTGIRVVDARTGGPIGYGRALLRWLATALVGWLVIPYLWMLWDPERQTWQDKIAGDVVVPAWWGPSASAGYPEG
ncbi:MAG: RDD family protein [Acidimicrobiales bacterium]